jgi:hypothetical protein
MTASRTVPQNLTSATALADSFASVTYCIQYKYRTRCCWLFGVLTRKLLKSHGWCSFLVLSGWGICFMKCVIWSYPQVKVTIRLIRCVRGLNSAALYPTIATFCHCPETYAGRLSLTLAVGDKVFSAANHRTCQLVVKHFSVHLTLL